MFVFPFKIPDETQLKIVHAAKCPNEQCDNPVQVPWKENCQLVMKPPKHDNSTEESSSNDVIESEKTNGGDDVIHCSECGTKFTEQHVECFRKAMEFTELHIQNMKGASVACILFNKSQSCLIPQLSSAAVAVVSTRDRRKGRRNFSLR